MGCWCGSFARKPRKIYGDSLVRLWDTMVSTLGEVDVVTFFCTKRGAAVKDAPYLLFVLGGFDSPIWCGFPSRLKYCFKRQMSTLILTSCLLCSEQHALNCVKKHLGGYSEVCAASKICERDFLDYWISSFVSLRFMGFFGIWEDHDF